MWANLLVPHDFSRCAARALDVAAALAASSGGRVTLAHVSPLPPNLPHDARVAPDGAGGESLAVDRLLEGGARRDLDELARPLRARGIEVRIVAHVAGAESPSDAILRLADQLAVDVIVMGTHGRQGLARLLLGSVAEEVVRAARVPVVTIRSLDDEPHPTREESQAEDELTG